MRTKVSDRDVEPLQTVLLVDTFETAVDGIAYAIGGRKVLALKLWPAKGSKAEGWLDDCLNPQRRAKLSPEEIMYVLRLGREAGVHTLMCFLADQASYSRPSPIEPEDQKATLQREYLTAVKHLSGIAARLEQLK